MQKMCNLCYTASYFFSLMYIYGPTKVKLSARIFEQILQIYTSGKNSCLEDGKFQIPKDRLGY